MESTAVPPALRERLGGEGTVGLLELLETTRRAWSTDVTTTCLDRFERRLVEEVAGLRVEIANLRGEMLGAMAQLEGRLRADLGKEMQTGFGAVRQELANNRVEFLKWAFLFWVGQFFAVAGFVAVLMRTTLAR